MTKFLWIFLLLFLAPLSYAMPPLHLAVSTNFETTAKKLVQKFQEQSDIRVIFSSASTGILATQIEQGAPYDIFLAADQEHVTKIIKAGKALTEPPFTYAIGKLVLWYPNNKRVCLDEKVFVDFHVDHLVLANPAIAPYGLAAKQTLQHLSVWHALSSQLVFANSVSQAFSYVTTGNAAMGFVALAEVLVYKQHHVMVDNTLWLVPSAWYQPLPQQAVLLQHAKDNASAKAFIEFLKSASAKTIIKTSGYDI